MAKANNTFQIGVSLALVVLTMLLIYYVTGGRGDSLFGSSDGNGDGDSVGGMDGGLLGSFGKRSISDSNTAPAKAGNHPTADTAFDANYWQGFAEGSMDKATNSNNPLSGMTNNYYYGYNAGFNS